MEISDRLDALLQRFRVQARQFHIGQVCTSQRYDPRPGTGFLHVLRAGEVSFTPPGSPHPVRVAEPSVLLFPHATPHAFTVPAGATADLACATLDFAGGEAHPLVGMLPEHVIVPLAEVPGLGSTLELLATEASSPLCGHRHVIDKLFEIVLIKLIRHLLEHPEAGRHPHTSGLLSGLAQPQLARALTAMHESPEHPWTLAELAEIAHLSRSAFSLRFRELVGVPPHEYLIGWRITVAQQLLLHDHAVIDVATAVGYSGTSFSRLFAQRVGQSPRAWAQTRAHAGA
ncbi:AraC family transcriptional regulator [Leucobacter sp. 7(1)]|uniref:AraC family transcriptional regulator n=1 Tax=Leucobacter sp. 7(1) TaxID=1255613 RepID=UPI000B36253B|nr:AraC family transcriptional regulator [Leucobacter sp. 7(1)]